MANEACQIDRPVESSWPRRTPLAGPAAWGSYCKGHLLAAPGSCARSGVGREMQATRGLPRLAPDASVSPEQKSAEAQASFVSWQRTSVAVGGGGAVCVCACVCYHASARKFASSLQGAQTYHILSSLAAEISLDSTPLDDDDESSRGGVRHTHTHSVYRLFSHESNSV